jgi:hypothetical protein
VIVAFDYFWKNDLEFYDRDINGEHGPKVGRALNAPRQFDKRCATRVHLIGRVMLRLLALHRRRDAKHRD